MIRKNAGVVAVTVLIIAAAYYGSTVPVLSNWLGLFFGVAAGAIGLLFAAQSLGALIGAVSGGVLLDATGPLFSLSAGSVGLFVGYAVVAAAPVFPLFLLGAVLLNVSYTIVGLAAPFYLLSLKPSWARRSFALGLVSTAAPGLVFPLLAEHMLSATNTAVLVRIPPAVIAVFTAVAAFGFFTGYLRRRRSPRNSRPGGESFLARTVSRRVRSDRGEKPDRGAAGLAAAGLSLRTFLRRAGPAVRLPRFWLFFILAFLHGTADTFIHNWYPRFLRGAFETLPIRPGLVLTLFSVAYVVSRVVLMLLPDEFGRRALLIAPGLLGGAILLGGLYSGDPVLTAIAYPVAAFCWSWEMPSLLSEANRAFPEAMGTFLTVSHTVSYAMGVIFHTAAGLLVDSGLPLVVVLSLFALFYIAFGLTAWLGVAEGSVAVETEG